MVTLLHADIEDLIKLHPKVEDAVGVTNLNNFNVLQWNEVKTQYNT